MCFWARLRKMLNLVSDEAIIVSVVVTMAVYNLPLFIPKEHTRYAGLLKQFDSWSARRCLDVWCVAMRVTFQVPTLQPIKSVLIQSYQRSAKESSSPFPFRSIPLPAPALAYPSLDTLEPPHAILGLIAISISIVWHRQAGRCEGVDLVLAVSASARDGGKGYVDD